MISTTVQFVSSYSLRPVNSSRSLNQVFPITIRRRTTFSFKPNPMSLHFTSNPLGLVHLRCFLRAKPFTFVNDGFFRNRCARSNREWVSKLFDQTKTASEFLLIEQKEVLDYV